MVSIPDWSRLSRLLDTPRETVTPGARYYKQRQQEAVKQAEEHGYFLNASRSFLESQLQEKEEENELTKKKSVLDKYTVQEKDLGQLKMLRLAGAHLRTVGDIGLCTNLTVCVLSNNYITRIDGLISCVHLIKLDLHSNQITMLPSSGFWMCLRQLKILNLHDNPIGRLENLNSLAASPCLVALTLYDTPLSLKRNYRHHVVNSIWSLRGLDYYVISDEEIIEDADFGGRFQALHPSFSIDLCPPTGEDSDYDSELDVVHRVLSGINAIQAHCSPVLIIQRFVRGFLVRKIVQLDHDLKNWDEEPGAVMAIQKKYQGYKAIEDTSQPPSTPAVPPQANPTPTEYSRLDYDTYMRNRRPGSRPSSQTSLPSISAHKREEHKEGSLPSHPPTPVPRALEIRHIFINLAKLQSGTMQSLQDDALTMETALLRSDGSEGSLPSHPPTPVPSALEKRHIFINLAKLQSGTMQSLQDDALTMETALLRSDGSYVARTEAAAQQRRDKVASRRGRRQRGPRGQQAEGEKKKRIMSVKQFFGPVVQTVPSPEPGHTDPATHRSGADEERREEEIPLINFRLKGLKRSVEYYEPTSEMLLSKQEAGRDVRLAEDEHHRRLDQQPMPTIDRPPPGPTREQRLFERVQNTMGLSCLWAVQQAYKDRAKAEKTAAKMEGVLVNREQRDAAKQRIKLFHEERRQKAQRERETDRKLASDALETQELARISTLERSSQARRETSQRRQQRKQQLTFVADFTVQNNSVSNALLRHDRQARKEDSLTKKADLFRTLREGGSEQQDVVKKYLEHRQLMRQTETALQRAALDTRMLQEANERLMEAKQRVLQQKQRSATVEAFYPLPTTVSSNHAMTADNLPLHPSAATSARAPASRQQTVLTGLNRFETQVVMNQGRVGRHHTQVAM